MKFYLSALLLGAFLLAGCTQPNRGELIADQQKAKEHFDKFLKALDAKNYEEAKKNVDIACDIGFSEACYADGQLSFVAKNYENARARYEKACELGHKYACTQLGIVLITLNQIDGGVVALDRACQMGDGLGCGNLGAIYSGRSPQIKADAARSKAYYKKACELGAEQTQSDVDFCELAK